jgi:hypothetical protein
MRLGAVLLLSCCTVATTAALGTAARAQLPSVAETDVIVQKDGVMRRGRVTELRPGRSVRLILLDGERRIVKWGDIARASGPSFAGVALPGAAPVAAPRGPASLARALRQRPRALRQRPRARRRHRPRRCGAWISMVVPLRMLLALPRSLR